MLDKNSITSFLEQDIHAILISFIQSGCAGTKVSIKTEFERAGLVSAPLADGLTAYYKPEEQEVLE